MICRNNHPVLLGIENIFFKTPPGEQPHFMLFGQTAAAAK